MSIRRHQNGLGYVKDATFLGKGRASHLLRVNQRSRASQQAGVNQHGRASHVKRVNHEK